MTTPKVCASSRPSKKAAVRSPPSSSPAAVSYWSLQTRSLARKLGLKIEADRQAYDLAIIGGGPAVLAAAIYAAREGIDAVVIDRSAMGGQAGVTERIDNYPGFPEGVGGAELADKFIAQARRYSVEFGGCGRGGRHRQGGRRRCAAAEQRPACLRARRANRQRRIRTAGSVCPARRT